MLSKQTVLIVEDDPTWQALFTEIIEDAGFRPVVKSSVKEAVRALDRQAFVLAVVDISLSLPDHADRGGVEVLKHLANLPRQIPAIVVTGYATVDLAVETLADLDAAYFFRKEEFDRAKFIDVAQKLTASTGVVAMLSARELEVLWLMGDGLTNKEIAERLVVSVNTIKKHAQNIFTKLNVDSRAAAVAKALRREER